VREVLRRVRVELLEAGVAPTVGIQGAPQRPHLDAYMNTVTLARNGE